MRSTYESKLKSEEMDFLFDAILSLKDKEECYRFFEDICTINEIKALAQRLQVAKMLIEKRTYLDIADSTGASTATISRVNRALNYGCDGYKIILKKLKDSSK
ncbi:YerC/YecD family TrpR-related protein [Haloimpatiens sp. FM7330]|uniref:YerC/YecD family TrpR-related protein n=1 Tax=Haloimpatiens sp. FM7330 TaxID=3298610 RepID=UPI003634A3A2